MADKERELSREERLERDLSRAISRRKFLVGSALLVGAAAGGALGHLIGEGREKGRHEDPDPGLRDKLLAARYLIYEPEGETIEYLRATGVDIPPIPLTLEEGDSNPEQDASEYGWMAVGEGGIYVPGQVDAGEPTTVSKLDSLVSSESRNNVGKFDSGLRYVSGKVIDIIGFDQHLKRTGRQGLLNGEGLVLTATRIGDRGIAIDGSGNSYRFIDIDISRQEPVPPSETLRAGGIVVAK